jgi:hypothetical protein
MIKEVINVKCIVDEVFRIVKKENASVNGVVRKRGVNGVM